ncbi:MAG: hypothetical protein LRY55_09020 [Leadbetterella sp.]|nr:hypothetical protein [Leadbetterella sp.]
MNKDVCLEAFSLARLLCHQYPSDSTRNLLALFCFHVSRIPAKTEKGRLVAFFDQDRNKWNKSLIRLGFHYLRKPGIISRIYLETVMVSRYMTVSEFTPGDWADMVKLYEMMQLVSDSPIVRLNYCFCLSKIGETGKALAVLSEIEKELPCGHLYFSLVKANLLKEVRPEESHDLYTLVMNKMNHKIRKEYLNELIRL